MNGSTKRNIVYAFLFLLPIGAILLNLFYLPSAITNAYQDKPDPFIKFLIDIVYPRFTIEKSRFDLSFFHTKANQVIYRACLVYYITLLLFYFQATLREKINRFVYTPVSSKSIDVIRIIFFTYLLYLVYELCNDLILMQPLTAFYKPVLLLRILHIPFPNKTVVLFIGALSVFSILSILANRNRILFTRLSFILFIVLQCWAFSFEKLDHGYATFTYAFLLFPFLFGEQKNNGLVFQSWSMQLIRFSIAMPYFLSAFEKLFTSQLSWLLADNLKGYLALHETFLSRIIIHYDWLCVLISSLTLLFQLSFILILFFPKYNYIWIIGGILFHTGTLIVMGIGHPLNPWIITYIFFLDWSSVYEGFLSLFKKSSLVEK